MNLEYMDEQEREEVLRAAKRRKRRKASSLAAVIVLILLLFLIPLLTIGGWELYKKATGDNDEATLSGMLQGEQNVEVISDSVVYTQAEMEIKLAEAMEQARTQEEQRILEGMKESFSQGVTTVEALRPFYPDDIVVASSGKIHFVPINRDLKLNRLSSDNLRKLETGEFQYVVDEQVISHKGIDVSSHQGKIDWEKVAGDGVEFAMIRVGFRGYGKEGKLVSDEYFEENITGARRNGIKVGVYFFSQAINEEELMEEAQLVLDSIAPYQLDCPVVYDVERVSSSNARMNALSVEERTALSLLFCETIEKAGYTPMLYHNTEMGALMLDIAAFEKYDKWYASYNSKMFYPYEYKIWQYSEKGKVNGIQGNVDMNISFAPVWKE